MLWESAYAELLFTDLMWPEFSANDLRAAIDEFYRRDRRYGALKTSDEESPQAIVPLPSLEEGISPFSRFPLPSQGRGSGVRLPRNPKEKS